jgi:hypothetical protein
MYAAFPRSEYYAGSAPPRAFSGRRTYPRPSLDRTEPGSGTRWFPRSLLTVRERRCPAMPLRHRPGYAVDLHQGLPAKRDNRPRSSSPGTARPVRTATQPISARFELVEALKGFTPLVPHVHLSRSLTGPMPSGSTGTSRRCRGCSHPHPRLRGQAASNFKRPATTGHRRSPSTPHGQTAPRGARRASSGARAVAALHSGSTCHRATGVLSPVSAAAV